MWKAKQLLTNLPRFWPWKLEVIGSLGNCRSVNPARLAQPTRFYTMGGSPLVEGPVQKIKIDGGAEHSPPSKE